MYLCFQKDYGFVLFLNIISAICCVAKIGKIKPKKPAKRPAFSKSINLQLQNYGPKVNTKVNR